MVADRKAPHAGLGPQAIPSSKLPPRDSVTELLSNISLYRSGPEVVLEARKS